MTFNKEKILLDYNKSIKDKVKELISIMEKDDNGRWTYFGCYENDPDYKIIEDKMNNLILLIEEKEKSPEEFQKLLDSDFDENIWYKL